MSYFNLGDITKIDGHSVTVPDVVVGGSPCQDLSVAGKRAGLDGERSGLFLEQIRVIKEMREKSAKEHPNEPVRPRYGIWENVIGAFSSNNGEDFRTVLEEFIRIKDPKAAVPGPAKGKWDKAGIIVGDDYSLAWRCMDAQYCGVPQRRNRVMLLCDFNGRTAGDILLFDDIQRVPDADNTDRHEAVMDTGGRCGSEIQSVNPRLQGYYRPCIAPWQGIARDPEEGSGGGYQ